jgi:ribosomal protein S18 acetylase RimI-like enzyme
MRLAAHPKSEARRPPSRPLLRDARAGDASTVAILLGQLGYPCSRGDAAQRIATMLEDPTQSLVVAEFHGDVCGLLALDTMYYLPLGAPTCRITSLIVDEAHRRDGLGRLLLREAERRARACGAVRIELTSAAHRHAAHAFYKASGYEESSLRFVKRLGEA